MAKVDKSVIGTHYGQGDASVDNLELLAIETAIQSHPVEVVGRTLRGYMTAMKAIAVGDR
jgi:ketol-acid reductoisomerase